MNATFLQWDSDFFERRAYKLEVANEPSKSALLQAIDEAEGNLYYIFSKKDYPVFDEIGAKLVDTKLVYAINLENTLPPNTEGIVSYTNEDTTDLLSLAILSGTYSRFKTDKVISGKFEAMYNLWLTRSLNRQIADEVFIYKTGRKTTGFVTVKQSGGNTGVIGLIAVDEAEQGKSIGKQLVNKVKAWCRDNGIKKLTVATQKENRPACRFYERCGFTVDTEDFIYHYHRA